jgi:ribosome-binding factor A
MSVKIDRLGSNFVKIISQILATEIKDENIKFVTITGCEVTNDLSFAKVYFTVLDMNKKNETMKSLEKAKSFIRGEISKRINIRHTPELRFIFDDSIEYGNKIERLINDINNK